MDLEKEQEKKDYNSIYEEIINVKDRITDINRKGQTSLSDLKYIDSIDIGSMQRAIENSSITLEEKEKLNWAIKYLVLSMNAVRKRVANSVELRKYSKVLSRKKKNELFIELSHILTIINKQLIGDKEQHILDEIKHRLFDIETSDRYKIIIDTKGNGVKDRIERIYKTIEIKENKNNG